MIQETILKVKDTENQAANIVAEAKARSATIVRDAREEADQILKNSQANARQIMDQKMAAAKAEGDTVLSANAEKSQAEAKKLRKDAAAKMALAVDAVTAEVLK